VADGVNAQGEIYLIKTEVTQNGGTVRKGLVEKREKLTRRQIWEAQDEDEAYSHKALDRGIVNKSQIRTVIQTFRDQLPEIFPDRTGSDGEYEVPKTLTTLSFRAFSALWGQKNLNHGLHGIHGLHRVGASAFCMLFTCSKRNLQTQALHSVNSVHSVVRKSSKMDLNEITEKIIGAAHKVLFALKPGLDEKLYERALVIELTKQGLHCEVQREFIVRYDSQHIGSLIPDLIVEDMVIVDPRSSPPKPLLHSVYSVLSVVRIFSTPFVSHESAPIWLVMLERAENAPQTSHFPA
jgi:GxxExxY protein